MPTYWGNEDRYVSDLNEAAEYAQATGDWSRYVQIQRHLAAESALTVLAPYASAINESVRAAAKRKAEEAIPGISRVRQTAEWKEAMNDRPLVAKAIEAAEANPQNTEGYIEVLRSGLDVLFSRGQAGVQSGNHAQKSAAPAGDSRRLSIEEISQLSAQERRRYLDARRDALGDTSIDVADLSAEAQLRY